MDRINKKEKRSAIPTPEVPQPGLPWEAGVETPVADAAADGGTQRDPAGLSLLGNTALEAPSLGNALPDLPLSEAGDPVLTGPLVADPFSEGGI